MSTRRTGWVGTPRSSSSLGVRPPESRLSCYHRDPGPPPNLVRVPFSFTYYEYLSASCRFHIFSEETAVQLPYVRLSETSCDDVILRSRSHTLVRCCKRSRQKTDADTVVFINAQHPPTVWRLRRLHIIRSFVVQSEISRVMTHSLLFFIHPGRLARNTEQARKQTITMSYRFTYHQSIHSITHRFQINCTTPTARTPHNNLARKYRRNTLMCR